MKDVLLTGGNTGFIACNTAIPNYTEEEMFNFLKQGNMKFKVGDKVVPHTKSTCDSLEWSSVWNRAKNINQPFLYVTENKFADDTVMCDYERSNSGDYFKESDLTLYEEPKGFVDSLGNPIKEGDMVYISGTSIADAISSKIERIFFLQRGKSNFTVDLDCKRAYELNERFHLSNYTYIVSVNSIPKEKKVKLNSDYTAIVTADTVKVGCQTFRKDVILDVVNAMKSFE